MLVPNERKGIETAFGFPVVLASMVCGQWLPQPGFDDNGDEEKPQAASSFVI